MKRFLAWSLAGALMTFGVLGILSIGLPFLVAGTALTALLTHRIGTGEAYGAAFGVAAVLFALAFTWTPGSAAAGAIALAGGIAACFASASHARERQL